MKPAMHWSNKPKFSWLWLLIAFLGGAGVTILALVIFGPLLGGRSCTLVDCMGNGVHLQLAGRKLTGEYFIEIEFPSGKRTLTCGLSNDSFSSETTYPNRDHCELGGAFFAQLNRGGRDDKPPEKLVVTVVHGGERFTQTFHPEYKVEYPNGEDCDPMCYFTTIEFVFPK